METATIGIIGEGSFGKFLKGLVPSGVTVLSVDGHATAEQFAAVCQADIVFLAIPLASYTDVLPKLAARVPKDTLVVDVCSVKMLPEKLFMQHLGDHTNILLTHPLFGPESAARSAAGFSLIITKSRGARAKGLLSFCEQELGLKIIRMTSEEHDKAMAEVHAVTFFMARGLGSLPPVAAELHTPSYNKLLSLAELDMAHSEDLFLTIEQGNPFAKAARQGLLKTLQTIHQRL